MTESAGGQPNQDAAPAGAVNPPSSHDAHLRRLAATVMRRAPADAADLLSREDDADVARVLGRLPPAMALKVLSHFPERRRGRIVPSVQSGIGEQWVRNQQYAEDSVGRLMEPATAVFGMGVTVGHAMERIRELLLETLVTYAYVTDDEGRLRGVVVMRDLMFAEPETLLIDVMLPEPYCLGPETLVSDAMKAVVQRHYPIYPVCDAEGRLIGIVHGYMLFEQHAFEISAQPGRMVGVEKEERVTTGWVKCLKFRHPWLQLNLLTAFLAASVVGQFESTIEQVVVLAAFLPVLAGQSGNTGCQALAVTVRGLTLGDFVAGLWKRVVVKEAWLGLLNGALVGLVAGGAMYAYALQSGAGNPLTLALVVFSSMTGACVCSGVTGVLVPLTLKRLGADPATASSIFLTTATDVVSMGLFLGLARLLVL